MTSPEMVADMTEVFAAMMVSFLVGAAYTHWRCDRTRERLMHEIHILTVRLDGMEKRNVS